MGESDRVGPTSPERSLVVPSKPSVRMKRRSVLALAVLGASGCLGYFESEDNDGITNPDDLANPDDLVIAWHDLVRENPGTEEERVYVFGIVENEGDRELSYVEVRATFYDADGEELDSVIEHVEDVTSGEEWEFEIEYPRFGEEAAQVTDYELEVGTSV